MIKQIGYFSAAIAVLLLAYMTSLPLPDNMPEPWKTRLFMASTRFPYFMVSLGKRAYLNAPIDIIIIIFMIGELYDKNIDRL